MRITKGNRVDRKNILVITIMAICFLFISMESLSRGFQKALGIEIESGFSRYFYLILVGLFGITMIKRFYRKVQPISIILFIYALYFIIIYNANMTNSIRDFIFSLSILLWIFCFKMGGNFVYWNSRKLNNALFYFSLFVIIPLAIYSFILFRQSDILSLSIGGNDAIFAVSVYLPFIFALKEKKILKIILIITFLAISLLSIKRSIILATLLAMLVYTLLLVDKKKIIKYIFKIYTVIAIAIGIFVYQLLEKLVLNNVIFRFKNISEDKGSGRSQVFSTLIDVFLNSDQSRMWFGHGFQGTREYVGILAHNDFINILFDFGLIGLFLYLGFIIAIIHVAVKNFNNRIQYRNEYATYIGTLILFFILSSINNMIYSPNLLMPITFIMGLSYMQLKQKQYNVNIL